MATIYITDETKGNLDKLVEVDNRNISLEVDFLCKERMKELRIPDESGSSVNKSDTTPTSTGSQGK